ncbi:unnamed protein product [Paramecium sonneborni]|uniref:Uncharacterized protein n=1 Tax=Paramecium sonneborni TaxID=65129 RepID=A0A8S1QTI6_9CILI|nr:unnamed protein product [Paramecium sonneborni]
MLIQKGIQILLDNPNEIVPSEDLQICKDHQSFFKKICAFCSFSKEPEEFYCKIKLEKPLNFFIFDIQEKKQFDIALFNAGISSYDQLIHKNEIQNLKQQGNNPKDIAIKLGLYTQQDIDELILEAIGEGLENNEQFSITIDFWEKSKTTTYLKRAIQILENLNLQNSIIIFPSNKANIVKLPEEDQMNAQKFLASDDVINQQATALKMDVIDMIRKSYFPEYKDVQIKRILNNLIKPLQAIPFSGEIVYFSDNHTDLQQFANKFGKQMSKVNIYCDANDIPKYYNIGGLTGGQVLKMSSDEKRQITHRIKAFISNNYIFTETQSSVLEKSYTEINLPIELDFKLIDPNDDHNQTGSIQVIFQDENGCFVQQLSIKSHDVNDMHEPSVSLSVQTMNLTELPKE